MLEALNNLDHTLMLQLNYDGGAFLDAFWYAVSYKFSWIPLYIAILIAFIRLGQQKPFFGPGQRNAFIHQGQQNASSHLKQQKNSIHQGQRNALHPNQTLRKKGTVITRLFNRPGGHLLLLILVTVLIILAADQLSSGLIKPLVERPRPSHEPGLMEQLHYVNDYHGGRFGFVSSHAANTAALALWLTLLFRQRALWWAMLTFYADNSYSRIYLGVHYPGDILCGTLLGILCALLGHALYNKVYSQMTPSAAASPASAPCAPVAPASAPCEPATPALNPPVPSLCEPATPTSSPCAPAPPSPALSRPITLTFWASILLMLLFAAI